MIRVCFYKFVSILTHTALHRVHPWKKRHSSRLLQTVSQKHEYIRWDHSALKCAVGLRRLFQLISSFHLTFCCEHCHVSLCEHSVSFARGDWSYGFMYPKLKEFACSKKYTPHCWVPPPVTSTSAEIVVFVLFENCDKSLGLQRKE